MNVRNIKTICARNRARLATTGAIALATLAPLAANADPITGTAVDVSGYAQTFADGKASLLAVVTGPGAQAMGLLLVSLIFGVVWGLYKKGVKSFGH